MGIGGRRWALVAAVAAVAAVPATALAAPQKRTAPRAAPVIDVSAPRPAVEAGARVVLSASVRNTASRSGRVAVAFHASADARRDARDRLLGSARTARLKPGARGTAKLSVRLRSAGTYTLFACVRAGGRTRCAKAPRKLVVRAARPAPTPAPAPKAPTPPAPPAEQPRQNPPAPGPPDPPAGNPALALQVASDVEWSTGWLPNASLPGFGDTIRTVLRFGAGVPGEAGYDRAAVPAVPVTGEEGAVLLDGGLTHPDGGDFDNWSVSRSLPFAFPFAGVRTERIAISTNGWIAAADPSPAFGPIGADASIDYRGIPTAFGDNVAAIAPFRADLTLVPPAGQVPGRIVLVRPAGGDSVTVRWEAYLRSNGSPVTFAAVLFRDGRVRFDYSPGPATPSGTDPLVGISPGVSGRSADLAVESALPTGSLLFTPRPVTVSAPAAAGTATLTLPRSSRFVATPGCTQTLRPTATAEGLVSCSVSSIVVGGTASVTIRWRYPDWLWRNPIQTATWTAATATRSVETELVQGVFGATTGARLELTPAVSLPPDMVGVEVVTDHPDDPPLRRPHIAGTVPPGLRPAGARAGGTVIEIGDLAGLCDQLPVSDAGGAVSCVLPTAVGIGTQFTLLFDTPAAGAYDLDVSLTADNLSRPLTASTSVNVP